jgi:hypothetical protein
VDLRREAAKDDGETSCLTGGPMLQDQSEALQFEPVFELCPDYEALQRALSLRASKLPIARTAIDEAIGWSPGYAGKALAEFIDRELRTKSIYELMATLGLSIIIVDDRDAIERSKKLLARFVPRKASQCRWNNKAANTGAQKKGAAASRPKKWRLARKRAA